MKRGSPKDVLEADSNPQLEQAHIKYPREELVTVHKNRKPLSVGTDPVVVRKTWKGHHKRPYTHIHTHPYGKKESDHPEFFGILPSQDDVVNFLRDDHEKTMVIAEQNDTTKELYGYLVVRKTKKTPKSGYSRVHESGIIGTIKNWFGGRAPIPEEMEKDMRYFIGHRMYGARLDFHKGNAESALDELCKKYHLQYRFVEGTDRKLYETSYGRERKRKRLEQIAVTTALLGLGMPLLGIISNMTGFSIYSLEGGSSSAFFIVGIIGCLVFVLSKFRKWK